MKMSFSELEEFSRRGDIESIRHLLRNGLDLTKLPTLSLLHDSTMMLPNFNDTSYLLFNDPKFRLYTPLILAIDGGHKEVAKLLIENNIDPTGALIKNISSTEVLKFLFKNGININHKLKLKESQFASPMVYGETIIHFMARGISHDVEVNEKRNVEQEKYWKRILEFLLENGADINAQDEKGNTPLFTAFQHSIRSPFLMFLLQNGANVNMRDNTGRTLLHHLSIPFFGNNSMKMLILLENGANIESMDSDGNTPLHLAGGFGTDSGNLNGIKLLLIKGARMDVENNNGDTPFKIAYMNNDVKSILLLLERGDNDTITASLKKEIRDYRNNSDTILERLRIMEDDLQNFIGNTMSSENNPSPRDIELLQMIKADLESKIYILNSNSQNDSIEKERILREVDTLSDEIIELRRFTIGNRFSE